MFVKVQQFLLTRLGSVRPRWRSCLGCLGPAAEFWHQTVRPLAFYEAPLPSSSRLLESFWCSVTNCVHVVRVHVRTHRDQKGEKSAPGSSSWCADIWLTPSAVGLGSRVVYVMFDGFGGFLCFPQRLFANSRADACLWSRRRWKWGENVTAWGHNWVLWWDMFFSGCRKAESRAPASSVNHRRSFSLSRVFGFVLFCCSRLLMCFVFLFCRFGGFSQGKLSTAQPLFLHHPANTVLEFPPHNNVSISLIAGI